MGVALIRDQLIRPAAIRDGITDGARRVGNVEIRDVAEVDVGTGVGLVEQIDPVARGAAPGIEVFVANIPSLRSVGRFQVIDRRFGTADEHHIGNKRLGFSRERHLQSDEKQQKSSGE